MLIGLDVGGTHTDAVIIDREGIRASAKVITRHDDLLSTITEALGSIFSETDPKNIRRINLSTTLSTNAIVENKTERVGVIVSSGPGIDPDEFRIGGDFQVIEGSIDHRGSEMLPLKAKQIDQAVRQFEKEKIRVFAVATKFSTRNPGQENMMRERLDTQSDFTTVGHMLSGQLNFPRRIATAYYNSAVWRVYSAFTAAIEESIGKYGIHPVINILKADGGTMPLSVSRKLPVESILSGPAASVMGIISLCSISGDSIILDIGGTTTDIAVFAAGAPIIEDGISLNSHRTLVRALKTRSIGIGGDSVLKPDGSVGPERRGPSMADGGGVPTLVDVLNYSGIVDHGNREASLRGIGELAAGAGKEAGALAAEYLRYAMKRIHGEVDRMVNEINGKPVYTIHEMLQGVTIKPESIYCMGGPARALAGTLEEEFGMKVTVPDNYAVANAVGAALTRTTMDIELFADTERGVLIVPSLNINREIQKGYTLEHATDDARRFLQEYFATEGIDETIDAEILEAQSFNMIGGYYTTGRNIRVKCQIKPGVMNEYRWT